MRELFDEMAGQSPLDPREASRKSSRTELRKKFYQNASAVEADGGFVVALDGKPIRTPGKNPLVAPNRELAQAIAGEWNAQGDSIDPMSMPLTRLANSAIDGVAENTQAVADDIAKYFGSDLLFYRAGFPEELVARQAQHWDPVLRWAADDLGAHFILTEGVMHVAQPDTAIAAARDRMPKAESSNAWPVAAMHVATAITGSALLALALKEGFLDSAAVWAAAHVDEDWNREKWGADEEIEARRAARHRDFEAAALVIKALA
ncbi:MAG: ATPase [Afipia sp.]|nr:ATPase [Afipia sp.]